MLPAWEFEREGEVVRVDPGGPLIATDMELELAAAIGGLGILASFEELLAPHFESGALVPVLPDWWQEFAVPLFSKPPAAAGAAARLHRPCARGVLTQCAAPGSVVQSISSLTTEARYGGTIDSGISIVSVPEDVVRVIL